MRADYTITPRQLWCKFARDCIKEGLALRLIHLTAAQNESFRVDNRDQELPSWVPDFGMVSGCPYLNYMERFEDALPHTHWKSKMDFAPVSTVDDENRLSCTVLCFGEVVVDEGRAFLSRPLLLSSQSKEDLKDLPNLGSELPKSHSNTPDTMTPGTLRQRGSNNNISSIYFDNKLNMCLSLVQEISLPQHRQYRQFVPCDSVLCQGDLLCGLDQEKAHGYVDGQEVHVLLRRIHHAHADSCIEYRVVGYVRWYKESGFGDANLQRVLIV
jgi:hypothetical protein